MKLFRTKMEPDADGFYATAITADSLAADQMVKAKINEVSLILAQYDATIYAFSSQCPHAAADLSQGSLRRWKVSCPDHGYCFDMRNGRIMWPEDEFYRLKRYEVQVRDGLIQVKL